MNLGVSKVAVIGLGVNISVLRLLSCSQIIPYGTLSCGVLDSVADPDPKDLYVFGLPDPDPLL
jgi:hypothetical protein